MATAFSPGRKGGSEPWLFDAVWPDGSADRRRRRGLTGSVRTMRMDGPGVTGNVEVAVAARFDVGLRHRELAAGEPTRRELPVNS